MKSRINLLIVLSLLLLGCHPPIQASNEQLELHSQSSKTQANLGQTLPISAKAIISGKVINLEVAQTPEQQAMGLMYRTALADDQGMMFSFIPERPVAFWMKNTLIPLDMVFLRKGVVQAIAANVPPCTSDPCPTYPSGKIVDNVIELKAGRAKQLGLKVGDRVRIQLLDKK